MAALRFHHRLHPFMAFASGVLVATAMADLLPEAHALVGDERGLEVGIAAVVGYLVFTLIESFIHQQSFEHASDHDHEPGTAERMSTTMRRPAARVLRARGPGILAVLPPASLIVHSTLDGLAIGLAFQAGARSGSSSCSRCSPTTSPTG